MERRGKRDRKQWSRGRRQLLAGRMTRGRHQHGTTEVSWPTRGDSRGEESRAFLSGL